MAYRREHMETLKETRLVDVSSTLIGRQLMPPLQHKPQIYFFSDNSATSGTQRFFTNLMKIFLLIEVTRFNDDIQLIIIFLVDINKII